MRPQDSDGLERLRDWHIILAGSGMCDAGRIRRHLKRLLWRKETTVLITGFQAAGSLGRILLETPPLVRIQGDDVRVNARIRSLDVYSGHADAASLIDWLAAREPVRGQVFLAHGEPEALEGLRDRITAAGRSGDQVTIPRLDQTFSLTPTQVVALDGPGARLAPGAEARPDWHNARAGLLETLNETLQALPTDAERDALLARLTAAVASGAGQGRP